MYDLLLKCYIIQLFNQQTAEDNFVHISILVFINIISLIFIYMNFGISIISNYVSDRVTVWLKRLTVQRNQK